jgi:hypothetical protein
VPRPAGRRSQLGASDATRWLTGRPDHEIELFPEPFSQVNVGALPTWRCSVPPSLRPALMGRQSVLTRHYDRRRSAL